MTQREILTAAIIASVTITGHRTLEQIKRQFADGIAYVAGCGVKNVERSLLNTLAATASAIRRIETEQTRYDRLSCIERIVAERARYDRLKNN